VGNHALSVFLWPGGAIHFERLVKNERSARKAAKKTGFIYYYKYDKCRNSGREKPKPVAADLS
jgi:hypothetical protein